MRDFARAFRVGAVALVVLLLVTTAAVGAVTTLAELQGTWTWYLRMERTVSFATPVVTALGGIVLVALFGLAAFAPRD